VYLKSDGMLLLNSDGLNLTSGDYELKVSVGDLLGNTKQLTVPLRVVANFNLSSVSVVPNPASDRAIIRYRLGAAADEVIIRIYDSAGRRIKSINGDTFTGDNYVEWDLTSFRGKKVANGAYFVKVEAKSGSQKITADAKVAVLQ
ncbi:MAG: FlgD immunoglobulin-like domain containing protein, partial [Candidatus Wallbacteria bacterium]|nr:FlgD immunoglobulin-like domain containing protein [Candidatus Wallbacteria bacterium]